MRIQVLLTAGRWGDPILLQAAHLHHQLQAFAKSLGWASQQSPALGVPSIPPTAFPLPAPSTLSLILLPLSPSLADHSPCPGGSCTRSRLSTQETDTEGGKLLWFAPVVYKGWGRLPAGPGRLRNGWFGTWSWQDGREFVEQERGEIISLGRLRIMCHHTAQRRE